MSDTPKTEPMALDEAISYAIGHTAADGSASAWTGDWLRRQVHEHIDAIVENHLEGVTEMADRLAAYEALARRAKGYIASYGSTSAVKPIAIAILKELAALAPP